MYCAIYGKLDFVEYLLAAGADVHADNDGALRWASYNGHTEMVKVLLAADADVHADNDGALRWASDEGHTEVVKVLLAAGADVHAKNDWALRWASDKGHTEVVKVLLAAGADVHADNDDALRWASRYGHTEIVKLLLAAGADVHANNDSALRWASDEGHAEVVEVLKDHIAKKKKVKESVNEKFTDNDSDPITDMGIGIFTKHDFNNEEDMLKFMVIAIPSVLKMSKIPNDIVNPATFSAQEGAFNWKYYFIIKKYVNKYIYLNGNDVDFDTDNICGDLHEILNKMGYPKTK
jgi:ankyrin repeat protein